MFTTFVGTPLQEPALGVAGTKPRPKRNQVQRACDWCRLTRIKCDNNRPCHHCKQSNRQCSTAGPDHFRSVAAATKEVERLRTHVLELESQLKQSSKEGGLHIPAQGASQVSSTAIHSHKDRERIWSGIRMGSTYYGVFSLPFFLKRMSSFLGGPLQQPHLEVASYSNISPSILLELSLRNDPNDFLQRPQEDYFLDLFWESYHGIYPLVKQADFRHHYNSIWADVAPGQLRAASPLVDIIIALCLQFGSSFITGNSQDEPTNGTTVQKEAIFAGFAYYKRCQSHVESTLERPSIETIQCYVFTVIYLLNAGLINTAHALMAKAIRLATILGLNNESKLSQIEDAKDHERYLWWTLYVMDTQLSLELGRSPLILAFQPNYKIPSSSTDIAGIYCASYIDIETGTSPLGFQDQMLRLFNALRTVYTEFYEQCDTIIEEIPDHNIYSNDDVKEKCAQILNGHMNQLNAWIEQVPDGYKMPRISGRSLSVDRSRLEINPATPIWLQRQRLILELQYHTNIMNIQRTFTCFSSTPATATPLSDNHSRSCISHAIALTNIIHQVLVESDILNGWYQVFQWQKNAVFVMLGFICGYPVCPPTPVARKAITKAIAVFEMFGSSFSAARQATTLTKQLLEKADNIISCFRSRLMGINTPSLISSDQSSPKSGYSPVTNMSELMPQPGTIEFQPSGSYNSMDQSDSLWAGIDPVSNAELWTSFMEEFNAPIDELTNPDLIMNLHE